MTYKAHMRRYYINDVEYTMAEIMQKFGIVKETVYKIFSFETPTSIWNGNVLRFECYRTSRYWIVDGIRYNAKEAAAAADTTYMTMMRKSAIGRPSEFTIKGHKVSVHRFYEQISREQMPTYSKKSAAPLKQMEKIFDYVTLNDGTRVVRQFYAGSDQLIKSYSWSEGQKYLQA